jgi:hypothetical protein
MVLLVKSQFFQRFLDRDGVHQSAKKSVEA